MTFTFEVWANSDVSLQFVQQNLTVHRTQEYRLFYAAMLLLKIIVPESVEDQVIVPESVEDQVIVPESVEDQVIVPESVEDRVIVPDV